MVVIGGQRASLAQTLLEGLGGVLEGDVVDDLILVLTEVQVLDDGGKLRLLGGVAVDAEIELTPTLVRA